MNGFRIAALVMALAGLATLGYAVATGAMRIAFLLIFPVVYGSGALGFLGIVLLFGAFVAWSLGAVADVRRHAQAQGQEYAWQAPGTPDPERAQEAQWGERQHRTRGGGVLLLGPIPIVWGSDQGVAKTLLILALVVMGVGLILTLLLRA